MIYKNTYVGVSFMLGHILLGASIGAVVGYLIPPGSFFWFSMGAVAAYSVSQYINHRKY